MTDFVKNEHLLGYRSHVFPDRKSQNSVENIKRGGGNICTLNRDIFLSQQLGKKIHLLVGCNYIRHTVNSLS